MILSGMWKHRQLPETPSQSAPPMLRADRLPGSLMELLEDFRPCFTAPTFLTFVLLATGLVARPFSAVVAA